MMEKGNVAGAKKYLNEALETNAINAEAHYQMGNLLWKKEKKTDEALKEYQKASTTDPNNPMYYENWALLLEELNRKPEAVETWKKCMIYLNEALKKDEIQARIDKLEKGESVGGPTSADRAQARAESDKKSQEDMEKLKKEMRKDKAESSKRIDAPPPDVMGDIADINKTSGEEFDLRSAAKKKAADGKTEKGKK
jgi:tetratricopeptide (TPR) repeat protein